MARISGSWFRRSRASVSGRVSSAKRVANPTPTSVQKIARQELWGPIGDRYGRRLPVAIGLVFFIIGSAGCALAGSASAMIGWRVVQAVGACAGVVLARAMVRDLYAGERAAQMMSTLMTVMAIAPLLGPIVGGQILNLSNCPKLKPIR
jgi:Major Facilitator Superfamily